MFKALVLILSMAVDPVGYADSVRDFPTQEACAKELPAYVARTQREHPGFRYQAACVDKAALEKIQRESKDDDGSI